jgi:hypothetical protein
MKPRLAEMIAGNPIASVFSLLLHAEGRALDALEDFHVGALALQKARIAELRDLHTRAVLAGRLS